ncbi:hypothetical protein UFOVP73_46 [uncultured Caudovirales phage]|uniref:DUF4376 domain-containing protein n=1 Tax=uncultured Caudovirales phage TaxID=2100421 RepID=A0A6J5KVR5_9CAUD|nr:hypothetical protein UFOVP73_46 [uncultured Caudovirales phage]CAB5194542.1 hypothetical protein UFOVP170_6 [uncultured Caudovirales phage]
MITYQDNQFCNGPDTIFETLAEAKADRAAVVDLVASSLRNQATAGTSPAEMSSWPLKLAAAQAGGGPMLALEAQCRGITEADLIALVLDSAAQLSQLEAVIAGVSGKHRDAIAALDTIDDVCAYDMRNGWPEL